MLCRGTSVPLRTTSRSENLTRKDTPDLSYCSDWLILRTSLKKVVLNIIAMVRLWLVAIEQNWQLNKFFFVFYETLFYVAHRIYVQRQMINDRTSLRTLLCRWTVSVPALLIPLARNYSKLNHVWFWPIGFCCRRIICLLGCVIMCAPGQEVKNSKWNYGQLWLVVNGFTANGGEKMK